MQIITSTSDLKNAIQLLEVEQADKGQLLKEQFYLVYDSFQPARLINGTLSQIVSSPYLIDNILGTAIGLALRRRPHAIQLQAAIGADGIKHGERSTGCQVRVKRQPTPVA